MRCDYEGKIFAFISLHHTKTTCFTLEEVTFLRGFSDLFQSAPYQITGVLVLNIVVRHTIALLCWLPARWTEV